MADANGAAGWPAVPLGEVLRKSNEWTPLLPDGRYKEVTVRLWGKGVAERREAYGSEIAASERVRVRTDQFILSKIDARNGAIGLVPAHLEGAVVSSDFPVFDIDCNRALPKYIEWLSKTEGFVALLKAASEGTTNRVRLKEDRFLAFEIPLPALEEQRRIVARIENLNEKLDSTKKLRETSILETQNLLRAELSVCFGKIDKLFVKPLSDACEEIIDNLHSNPVYSPDGTVPCVRSSDVGWGSLSLENAARTSEDEYVRRTVRGEPQSDDIVFVREGGGTGKAALVTGGQRFSLGQRVMMLRPNRQIIIPKFFLYQLLSPQVYEEQIKPLAKGSASPHLNIGALRKFSFGVPPLAIQEKIVAHLDQLQVKLNLIKQLQTQTAGELDALLPAVLDKAFKGEL